MRIKYDREADAICIQFKKGRVSKDKEISENVFAGYSRQNELIEIQIIDISEDENTWITVEAAAQILKKSERTVLRWIQSGKIRSKKLGKEHRINLEDISEFAS